MVAGALMPIDRQAAFPFVVPLAMEGRWRMVRDGGEQDPYEASLFVFAGDSVTVTHFYPDGDGISIFTVPATFEVAGGRLTIETESDYQCERIAGAAAVVPDIIPVLVKAWMSSDPEDMTMRHGVLVREELALAVRDGERALPQKAAPGF